MEETYEVVWSFPEQQYVVLPYAVFERDWTLYAGPYDKCVAVANARNAKKEVA